MYSFHQNPEDILWKSMVHFKYEGKIEWDLLLKTYEDFELFFNLCIQVWACVASGKESVSGLPWEGNAFGHMTRLLDCSDAVVLTELFWSHSYLAALIQLGHFKAAWTKQPTRFFRLICETNTLTSSLTCTADSHLWGSRMGEGWGKA